MRRISGTETSTVPGVSPMLVMLMVWGFVTCPASGQSTAPEPVPARSRIVIPPPRSFDRKDLTVSRNRLGISTSLPGLQEGIGATSLPTATPLPDPPGAAESTPNANTSAATPPPPPRVPVDTTLIPGRTVEPIDLANALKLAGARDLDIAIARQRILQSAADSEPGPRPVAAIALLRTDMVSGGRPDPDGQRPGRDDRPQRTIPRRNGGAGQYASRRRRREPASLP